MSIAIAPAGGGLPAIVSGISDAELDTIRSLFDVWDKKRRRNLLRSVYFDGKMPLKPTGNIPAEAMRRITAVLDWPEKAVTTLAERSIFEGFVAPGGGDDPFELAAILDANRFDLELPQAITSAYKHSCSFLTTAVGDERSGEPPVVIMARSAEWSSALWDERRRVVSAALAITATDATTGLPTAMDVYLPDAVLVLTRRPSGSWMADRRPNPLGEVLVEPLTYDPQLGRPFGRSRISRTVMNITDHALTTIVRGEIGADFYAIPRIIMTKVAEDAFKDDKWSMAIDRFLGFTKDEDGEGPTVQQFQQMTMQPIMDQYRMYATQFSGATGVPVSNLGIVTDNPPSAEALYADDRRLVVTAKRQNRILGASLKRVAQKVIRLRDGGPVSDEMRRIEVSWANPASISPGAAADALVKLVNVFPWIGESEVALEMAGFTASDITRLLADKRRAQGSANLAALVQAGRPGETEVESSPADGDAADLKAKFDALGVAVRAGVDPADAARRLGLEGIKFTGAVPVSLRMPNEEATGLEDR